MEKRIKIYNENYAGLPGRFVQKINSDIDYLLSAGVPGLRSVYLFGSCARGEVRSSSDVDLLIVTDKKIEDRMLASDIRWTLEEEKDGIRTDIVYMNEDSIEENSVFKNVVNRDKKIILEVIE